MHVLGIDPGSLRVGWGLVRRSGSSLGLVDCGLVRLPAREALAGRLATIHREITGILQSYAPDAVAIESVFHGVNTRALVTLGQARGAVLAAVGQSPVELVELSPAEIKKAVTGRGRATKEQVAHMVGVLLGAEARARLGAMKALLDTTDALAVAIAAHHRLHRARGPLARAGG